MRGNLKLEQQILKDAQEVARWDLPPPVIEGLILALRDEWLSGRKPLYMIAEEAKESKNANNSDRRKDSGTA